MQFRQRSHSPHFFFENWSNIEYEQIYLFSKPRVVRTLFNLASASCLLVFKLHDILQHDVSTDRRPLISQPRVVYLHLH